MPCVVRVDNEAGAGDLAFALVDGEAVNRKDVFDQRCELKSLGRIGHACRPRRRQRIRGLGLCRAGGRRCVPPPAEKGVPLGGGGFAEWRLQRGVSPMGSLVGRRCGWLRLSPQCCRLRGWTGFHTSIGNGSACSSPSFMTERRVS